MLVCRKWLLITKFQMTEVDLSSYDSNELDILLAAFQPRKVKNVGSVFSKKTARVVVDEEKPDPMIDLMKFFAKVPIISLKMSDNTTNDHLSYLGTPPALKSLSLEGCSEVTDDGLQHLPKNLKSLELNSCAISDKGLDPILTNLNNLQHLSLAMTNISDAGIKSHANRWPATLTSLSLWNCANITDQSLSFLPKTLKKLYLRRTKITDVGLKNLNSNISELDLSGTKITDAGLKTLPPRLHTLVLYYTGVSTVGVLAIPGLSGIFHLDIRTTKVDAAGAQKIKAIMTTTDAELLHESVPPPESMTVVPM